MSERNRMLALALVLATGLGGVLAGAQSVPATKAQPAVTATPISEQDLATIHDQLLQLLRTSPKLTTVVARDPSLLADQDYVSRNNPQLAQFLVQHPEIARNPDYYLFTHLDGNGGRREQALERVPGARICHLAQAEGITELAPVVLTEALAASVGYQMDYAAADQKDFMYWLKAGFAFTLPLLAIGILLIVVLYALFTK